MSSIIIYREVTGTLSGAETIAGELTAVKYTTSTVGSAVVGSATIGETVTASDYLSGTLSATEEVSGEITIPSAIGGTPYTGEYIVTPTPETQTLATANKTLSQNVVVNPIPSNYGLITWNGSYLTVS